MKKIFVLFIMATLGASAFFGYKYLDRTPLSADMKKTIRTWFDSPSLNSVTAALPAGISNKNEKTMVRYKDDKGHWQFADKAPAGATNVSEIKVRTDSNNFSKQEFAPAAGQEEESGAHNRSLSNGVREALDIN